MNRDLDAKWRETVERHSAAVERFLTVAAGLDAVAWGAPAADGKWTPAQIAQHLVQTYEVLTRQLRTGEGLTVQTGWLLRTVLRVVVLRPIMWLRRLPPGARAPRDLLPGAADAPREQTLERLRGAVAEFEAELLARRDQKGLRLTHHIFGAVDAVRGLDFVAVHTEHHGRQLPAPRAPASSLDERASQ